MDIGIIPFTIVGAVALAAARNMVHSILFMVVVFLATAVIYLLFQAPVIAFLQITVYAGGIFEIISVLLLVAMIGAIILSAGSIIKGIEQGAHHSRHTWMYRIC